MTATDEKLKLSPELKPCDIRSGSGPGTLGLYDRMYETVKSQARVEIGHSGGTMTDNVAYQPTVRRDYRID